MKFKNVFKVLGISLMLMFVFTFYANANEDPEQLTIKFVSTVTFSPISNTDVHISIGDSYTLPICYNKANSDFMIGWSFEDNGEVINKDVIEFSDYSSYITNQDNESILTLYAIFVNTPEVVEQPSYDNNYTVGLNISKLDYYNYNNLNTIRPQWYKKEGIIDLNVTNTEFSGTTGDILENISGSPRTSPIFKDSNNKYFVEIENPNNYYDSKTYNDFSSGIMPSHKYNNYPPYNMNLYIIGEELTSTDEFLVTFNKAISTSFPEEGEGTHTYRVKSNGNFSTCSNGYKYNLIHFGFDEGVGNNIYVTNVKVDKISKLENETTLSLQTKEKGTYYCNINYFRNSDTITLKNVDISYDEKVLFDKIFNNENLNDLPITPQENPVIITSTYIINEHGMYGTNYPEDRGYTVVKHTLKFSDEDERKKVSKITLNGLDITNYLDNTVYANDGERYHALLENPNKIVWYPDNQYIYILFYYNSAFYIDISSSNLEIGKDISDLLNTIEIFPDIEAPAVKTFTLADEEGTNLTEGKLEANKKYILGFRIESISDSGFHDNYLNYIDLLLPNAEPNDHIEFFSTSNIETNRGFKFESQSKLTGTLEFTLIPKSSGGSKKYTSKEINKTESVDNKTGEKKEEAVITGGGKKGSKVTIKLPESRRVLEIVVKDKKGNDITLTKEEDGTLSFIQPQSNVDIEIKYIKKEIKLNIGSKEASVDDAKSNLDVAPQIRNDRTMLPIRFIAESLDAKVNWDEKNPNLVTIEKGDKKVEITIGSNIAKINGKEVELDVAAFAENDRTFMPVRFISEALDAVVSWDESKPSEVLIYDVE